MNFSSTLSRCAALALAIGISTAAQAQVSITTTGTVNTIGIGATYSQDFNSLSANPVAGTIANFTWTNNSTLPGWYAANNTGVNAARPDGQYRARDPWQTSNTRGIYSFGDAGSSERAFGSATTTSGDPIFFGVAFTNNSSVTLDSFTASLVVESYRSVATNDATAVYRNEIYTAEWAIFSDSDNQIGNTGLTWTSASALNLQASLSGTTLTLNQTALNWGTGDTLWLRWTDNIHAGQNAALGIDNFSFTAVPEPSTYAIILGACTLAVVGFRRFRTR